MILIFLTIIQLLLLPQESVFIETEDGWKLHMKYVKPKKEQYPLLLLVHSEKSNYLEWKNWFKHIEAFGYGWAAIDLRGHGISTSKIDGSSQTYTSFSLTGANNEYNKMIRDIDSAVIFISSSGISRQDNIFIIASKLGANVAAKYCVVNKDIAGLVLIHPYTTINDIAIIGMLRSYGTRPLLFVSPQNKKRINDTILLYNLTRMKTDPQKTFIIIEGLFNSAQEIKPHLINRILHWIKHPYMPNTIEIEKTISTSTLSVIQNSTNTLYKTSPYFIPIKE